MSFRKTAIIQWNIQGITNKKQEILQLINQFQASIVALQETMMPTEYLHKINNFQVYAKNGTQNRRTHGGVALYVHSSTPSVEVPLNTTLQAVAAIVNLKTRFTICNLYLPPSQTVTIDILNDLFSQLPKPCLILGDFNAYSVAWGCNTTNPRGRSVEQFIDQNNLILLNNGSPTHPNQNTDTAIDLSFSSPAISQDFEWKTLPSTLDSDHFPIIITTQEPEYTSTPKFILKRADWAAYRNSRAWTDIPEACDSNNEDLLTDLCRRINLASEEAIPQSTPSKYYPKPFWTPELTRSRAQREVLYHRYRRDPTLDNKIRWKRARAMHKNNVRVNKEESWQEYVSEITDDMPITTLCQRVRKMKGIPPKTIPILRDEDDPDIIYSTPVEIAQKLAATFAQVSSNNNYSPQFTSHKETMENTLPDFNDEMTPYNKLFTFKELQHVLDKCKDTTPGEDGVVYKMIKNMPVAGKNYVLNIFNKFFLESYFPPQYHSAHC